MILTRLRRSQRGFSLIVVFMLILVMVGISSAVMLSAQGDLQVTTHDREYAAAVYAAEAGVAWAQLYLYRFAYPSSTGTWTGYLSSLDAAVTPSFCIAGTGVLHPPQQAPVGGVAITTTPGALAPPAPGTPVIFDATRGISYQWCVHNNALDPNYFPLATAASDRTDGDNIITVESWGWYGTGTLNAASASAHLTVDVAYFNAATSRGNDYQQQGGNATKSGRGEISPNLPSSVSKSF